jgi:hypothetical protein
MPGYYVRMLSTGGQSACRTNNTSSRLQGARAKVLHQRLNVEHPSSSWFCQWLGPWYTCSVPVDQVGVTDGGGTFSISKQKNCWNLVFKISQSSYNLRLLFYIKRTRGPRPVPPGTRSPTLDRTGLSIKKSSDMASFRIAAEIENY